MPQEQRRDHRPADRERDQRRRLLQEDEPTELRARRVRERPADGAEQNRQRQAALQPARLTLSVVAKTTHIATIQTGAVPAISAPFG